MKPKTQVQVVPSYKVAVNGRKLWTVLLQVNSTGFHLDIHGSKESAQKYADSLFDSLNEFFCDTTPDAKVNQNENDI